MQSKNKIVRTRQSCRRCMQQTSSLGISYLNIPPFGLAPSSGPAAITAPHSPLTKRPQPRTAKLQSSDRESCETLCPSRFGRGCSTGNYPTCFTIPMDFSLCGSPHCASAQLFGTSRGWHRITMATSLTSRLHNCWKRKLA